MACELTNRQVPLLSAGCLLLSASATKLYISQLFSHVQPAVQTDDYARLTQPAWQLVIAYLSMSGADVDLCTAGVKSLLTELTLVQHNP